ncbi:hypothetical protein QE152_g25798 [Popillia japonica]|uniref:DUF7869 domain-containing protein n=1 Tax=Popillia japonica TaxID=7064 RepID=A0AAW1K0F3_POPJA
MRAAKDPTKYALKHFLDALESRYVGVDAFERPRTLKLFSDSCSGQNKNTAMMLMLLCYVQSSIFEEIQHVFPIKGHSFMLPGFSVFGCSEKIMRKQEKSLTISPQGYYDIFSQNATKSLTISPQGYYDIFSQNATVLQNDTVKDFKTLSRRMVRSKLPFKITEQRIFIYRKGSKQNLVKKDGKK